MVTEVLGKTPETAEADSQPVTRVAGLTAATQKLLEGLAAIAEPATPEADATEADATEADATEADATEADATEAEVAEAPGSPLRRGIVAYQTRVGSSGDSDDPESDVDASAAVEAGRDASAAVAPEPDEDASAAVAPEPDEDASAAVAPEPDEDASAVVAPEPDEDASAAVAPEPGSNGVGSRTTPVSGAIRVARPVGQFPEVAVDVMVAGGFWKSRLRRRMRVHLTQVVERTLRAKSGAVEYVAAINVRVLSSIRHDGESLWFAQAWLHDGAYEIELTYATNEGDRKIEWLANDLASVIGDLVRPDAVVGGRLTVVIEGTGTKLVNQ